MITLLLSLLAMLPVLLGGIFTTIAEEDFAPAPRRASSVGQATKISLLIPMILSRLHRAGSCLVADLDNDAKAAGLTGRCILQVSCGLGGSGGMNLYRKHDNTEVVCCRENVNRMIKMLGAAGFASWLAKEQITEDDFAQWYRSLPSVA